MSELEEDSVDEYDVDEDYDCDFEEYQDALDYCEECSIYGDDYYLDENGELVCRCFECDMMESDWDD